MTSAEWPVGAVGNRRLFAGFPRACGKRWRSAFVLGFEVLHGFPQPVSVHRPLSRAGMGLCLGRSGEGGLETAAVGLSFDDEVVGVIGEAVDDALGAEGVGEGGEPFVRAAV